MHGNFIYLLNYLQFMSDDKKEFSEADFKNIVALASSRADGIEYTVEDILTSSNEIDIRNPIAERAIADYKSGNLSKKDRLAMGEERSSVDRWLKFCLVPSLAAIVLTCGVAYSVADWAYSSYQATLPENRIAHIEELAKGGIKKNERREVIRELGAIIAKYDQQGADQKTTESFANNLIEQGERLGYSVTDIAYITNEIGKRSNTTSSCTKDVSEIHDASLSYLQYMKLKKMDRKKGVWRIVNLASRTKKGYRYCPMDLVKGSPRSIYPQRRKRSGPQRIEK